MKVLLVNGSSHKNGTTMQAIQEMVSVFEKEGVETEVIQLGGKPLADCLQCNKCRETGRCVFEDDGVNYRGPHGLGNGVKPRFNRTDTGYLLYRYRPNA